MAPRWRYGRRIKRDAYLRSVIRRAEWAGRMAGIPSAIVRRFRWRFWESLTADHEVCLGTCDWRDRVIYLDIVVEPTLEDTVCHEMAHAAHQQGERDFVGEWLDDHDEVWQAWQRRIRGFYLRDERGPKVIR